MIVVSDVYVVPLNEIPLYPSTTSINNENISDVLVNVGVGVGVLVNVGVGVGVLVNVGVDV